MTHQDGYNNKWTKNNFHLCTQKDFEKYNLNPIEVEKEYTATFGLITTHLCVPNFENIFLSGKDLDFNYSTVMFDVYYKESFL